jgi:hypothetical protein
VRRDPQRDFVERDQSDLGRPAPFKKIFLFSADPNHFYIRSRLAPLEGRIAIVTDAGWDAVDAGGAKDEGADLRTAKSCGPDASTLASSWRNKLSPMTVTTSPITGESTKETVKTIACGNAG